MPANNLSKAIKTEDLYIKNNLMCFEETRLQISNISAVSDGTENVQFPKKALIGLILGYICYSMAETSYYSEFFSMIATVLLAWGVIRLVVFIIRKCIEKPYLLISMNSGYAYRLTIDSKDLLGKILEKLEVIIMNGGSDGKSIRIDMSNAKVTAMGNINIGDHILF